MKKLSCLVALVACAAGSSLFAQQGDEVAVTSPANASTGGFAGTDVPFINSFQEVQILPEGSVIQLSGRIVGRLKADDYLLERAMRIRSENALPNERIVVEIEDDKWQGQVVSVSDWVEISGEVDRSDGITRIKASKVTKDMRHARLQEALERRRSEQTQQMEQAEPESLEPRRQRRLRLEEQQQVAPQTRGEGRSQDDQQPRRQRRLLNQQD